MASTLFTSCTISRGTEEEIQVSLIMMIMMKMIIMMMMMIMAMLIMMFRCEASAPPWSDNCSLVLPPCSQLASPSYSSGIPLQYDLALTYPYSPSGGSQLGG